jgi:uncharacterized paraquat-inducible protein A
MKTIIMLLIATSATFNAFSQKSKSNSQTDNSGTTIKAQYVCPMHPDVLSDKPGKCPKCNMDLTLSTKEQMKLRVTHAYTCPIHADVISNNPGTCPKCKAKLIIDRTGSKQGKIVYTCPMHPDVLSDKPGKCPKCNMDLTESKPKN